MTFHEFVAILLVEGLADVAGAIVQTLLTSLLYNFFLFVPDPK
jgi:hypothetical protein